MGPATQGRARDQESNPRPSGVRADALTAGPPARAECIRFPVRVQTIGIRKALESSNHKRRAVGTVLSLPEF